MKKKVLICVGLVCIVLLILGVILIIGTIRGIDYAKIADGTYRVRDCYDYPDAYIVVDGDKLQFHNIDLNAIYQDEQMEIYQEAVESGLAGMSEERLEKACDLNQMFVTEPYELDYESVDEDNKTGTFTYVYFCLGEQNYFGLVFEYDFFHKTLQVNDPVQTLVFEYEGASSDSEN